MLTLPIKKKWFDMIASGVKTEEYREIRFRNGYSGNSPSFVAKCSLRTGTGRGEWGAEPGKKYYILKIHEISDRRMS